MLPEELGWCILPLASLQVPRGRLREFSHLKLLIDWSPKTDCPAAGIEFFERAMQCSQNLQEFLPRSGASLF
jgi:hypothetical protein